MVGHRIIGKLARVPLREVWKHEAYDFTSWLQDNIDALNDVLPITLTAAEREQAAGTFSVDLVAEDEAGQPVIIENQLGKSDHDHLGKVITYLTAIGAKTAIWITADPRPEHIAAITWLNEASSASFYMFKVEAVKIGESPPAPLLTLIVGPSVEGREVGETKKELAGRFRIRHEFWSGLLEQARTRTNLHATISPGQYSWVGTGAGKAGLSFNYTIIKDRGIAELYIDRGKDKGDENKAIFDSLYQNREQIEAAFGGPLEWNRLEDKRACRIRKTITVGGYASDRSLWPTIYTPMIDAMIRLADALSPYINKLKI